MFTLCTWIQYKTILCKETISTICRLPEQQQNGGKGRECIHLSCAAYLAPDTLTLLPKMSLKCHWFYL